MHTLAEQWPNIRAALEIIGVVLVFIVMLLIALKWKIPMLTEAIKKLSERVAAIEKVAHQQDINKETLIGFVKKEELYDLGGDSKYMPRHACGLNQEQCQKIIGKDIKSLERKICEVKDDIEKYSRNQETQRAELIAVQKDMVAVAQQMRDVVTKDRKDEIKELAGLIVSKINGKIS